MEKFSKIISFFKQITTKMPEYYKNADTLPIWNFWKFSTTEDVRYLLKTAQEFLPEITYNQKQLLSKSLENLIYSLNKLDFTLLGLYTQAYISLLSYMVDKNSINEKKLQRAWADYLSYIIESYQNMPNGDNIKELYDKIKTQFVGLKFWEFRLKLFNYKLFIIMKPETNKKTWNLIDECTNIETITNKTIDIMTCSTNKYFAYRQLAENIIEDKKKNELLKKTNGK
jgi:hypothetical protein